MKHLLLFVCSLLFTATVFSQKIDTVTTDVWQNNTWQHSIKSIYSYNSSCFVTSSLTQRWQVATSSWADTLLMTYTYNGNLPTQLLTQVWNGNTNTWDNLIRETLSYNNNNVTDSILTDVWFNNTWRSSALIIYTYNVDGTVSQILNQVYLVTWTNSSRTNYTYNADKTVHQDVTQTFNFIFMNWTNSLRNTYTYNAAGEVLTDLQETWKNNQWANSFLVTNSYDGNNYLLNSLTQKWNTTTSTWVNNSQIIYTNNSDGTPAVAIMQTWDTGSGTWINQSRSTYSYSSSCALPLTLLNFTAVLNKKVVELNWTTLTESNTKDFIVQRSNNGTNFENIGTVNAVGNSTQKNSYQLTDATALNTGANKLYYRLQMTDKDGKFTYSQIAAVSLQDGVITVTLYPNPVHDVLYIKDMDASANTSLAVINVQGKIIAKITVHAYSYELNVKQFAKGFYYLRIIDENGKSSSYRFIKE